jgi:hypothetical protein
MLIAPGFALLKLKCDVPLSNVAFNFDFRRFTKACEEAASMNAMELSIRSMRTLIGHLEPYRAAVAAGTASKPPRSSG